MDKTLLIRIIIIVGALGAAFAALWGYNFFGTDMDSLPRETTIVERVYTKTEYSTRVVARRTVRTNPHQVYYLTLRRPNGEDKSVKVSFEVYRRASVGDTALLPIGPGRLGWEICNPRMVTIPHPRKPHTRHCRFVGTSGGKVNVDSILNSVHERKEAYRKEAERRKAERREAKRNQ